MNPGILYALLAFSAWGLFPLYFKALHQIPAAEMLAQRIAWSLLFLALVLVARRHWRWLIAAAGQPRVLARFAASGALLTVNWGVYIWSVNAGHIVEASLGYFVNPLINVLLGFALLGERLRRVQWAAIALAAAGVLWLTWQAGAPPWISLALALSFGGYSAMRKTARLGALEGLALETLLIAPCALLYLGFLSWTHHGAAAHATLPMQLALVASGPVTAVPLLLFSAGARRLPLSMLGVLQYVTPTLQLLTGVAIYHEPFGAARAAGYGVIWAALALYSFEGLWRSLRTRAAPAGTAAS